MKTASIALALSLAASSVFAEGLSPTYTAKTLVTLLSSEEACQLSYDKAAVDRYRQHFADQDQTLQAINSLAEAEGYFIKKMWARGLIVHCAGVRAAAKLYGFIP